LPEGGYGVGADGHEGVDGGVANLGINFLEAQDQCRHGLTRLASQPQQRLRRREANLLDSVVLEGLGECQDGISLFGTTLSKAHGSAAPQRRLGLRQFLDQFFYRQSQSGEPDHAKVKDQSAEENADREPKDHGGRVGQRAGANVMQPPMKDLEDITNIDEAE
jgi:hypothetical protein